MKINSMRVTLAAALLAWAGSTLAAAPPIPAIWQVESIGVGTHSSIPLACDPANIGGSDKWNAVGAKFYFIYNSTNYHLRKAEQALAFNQKNITIEDGVMVNVGAIMEAYVLRNLTTKVIVNADITVDKERINPVTPVPGHAPLICSSLPTIPNDRIDWQSAITHELGHAVGFDHTTDEPTCSMYTGFSWGEVRRNLCDLEKQAYLDAYGKAFSIVSIPNVEGLQNVNIPAKVFFDGSPAFPVTRKTATVQCASGWSCSDYVGTHSSTPSPLTFNFKCDPADPMPTATFRWRTTLTNANGLVTNAVEHTSTCTRPPGTLRKNPSDKPKGINRVIITN
ncbi:hypothetical protein ACFQ4Q_05915 [Lysobacter gummosus]|uniref:hypothetical protein n=1 Tax=Lysobacter gummosus TaxID=262324 RepID=UPI00362C7799